MTTKMAFLDEQHTQRLVEAEADLIIANEAIDAVLVVIGTDSLSDSDKLLHIKLLLERARLRQQAEE